MRVVSRFVKVDPVVKGIEEWLLILAIPAVVLGVVWGFFLPLPSPTTLRDIANLGIVIVLGYVVEAAWLATRVVEDDDDKDELGLLLGMGIGGLVGVIIAVLLAAHREAGHGNWLDALGLGWSIASLLALGAMVILQPMLTHIWGKTSK